MRTLLVDNYDSFTYNLFHYLSEVNDAEPTVIRNDEPGWSLDALAGFDNVLISPGPGSPDRPGDFGVCAEIIAAGRLPLLGVCLGHQGLGHAFGGKIVRAAEPRHGRMSAVTHTGRDLFAGLPSPFEAVRYHSLVVENLPDELEATAWTADGVLMGLRHRTRPLWGVQFHPESICTEYGHLLLRNFADLTRRWQAEHGRSPAAPPVSVPALPAPRQTTRRYGIRIESVRTRWQDEAVYDALFRGRTGAFWLDSSRADGSLGRYSVMGDATGPLARRAVADVASGTVVVSDTKASADERVESGFFDWLEADLRDTETTAPLLPGGFGLGWIGYLGYELKAECGGSAAHPSPAPDAQLVFADRAVVVDHLARWTHLLTLVPEDDAWIADTVATLRSLAGTRLAPPKPTASDTEIQLRHDRESYLKLIQECQSEINAGETYEVCLTNMITVPGEFDPWDSYRRLRRISPAPFAAFLEFGDVSVLSTSPERFLRIDRNGVAESKPIKGTRPRGIDEDDDKALAADLRGSEKDRSENLMIVDLVRNDLGRHARVGSVRVPRIFDVESYATVHQLVSTVSARLRPESSPVRCVQAAFPGGSMTGAPKRRTMEIIDRLELGARGVYSGAIGYFSLTGAVDLSIVIRTAVMGPNQLTYGVGGAIVALSDPYDEFEETGVKAAPLLKLVGGKFPDAK
ncbi:MAG TPA: aminodeoxychorismate synthase component I [Actinospica sp.]|jgi:para-aminobenzoate synthetase|nr:aminodeoxychorismate synthase component I [Actinospica sp.]